MHRRLHRPHHGRNKDVAAVAAGAASASGAAHASPDVVHGWVVCAVFVVFRYAPTVRLSLPACALTHTHIHIHRAHAINIHSEIIRASAQIELNRARAHENNALRRRCANNG